jgi:hypothetical protein
MLANSEEREQREREQREGEGRKGGRRGRIYFQITA